MPKEYHTKQRDRVLRCLRAQGDRHLTAARVTEILRQSDGAVGPATVYRHLERLVQNGTVRKYVTGQGSPACYQYVGDAPCGNHFHMRCVSCGRLFHLDCHALCDIADHIRAHHDFEIDPTKTVFYGTCSQCAEKACRDRDHEGTETKEHETENG